MTFEEINIFKLDIDSESIAVIERSTYGPDLSKYLEDLANIIATHTGGRQFYFERETTEIRTVIGKVLTGTDFSTLTQAVAKRLLDCETKAQIKVNRLNVSLQKGLLVQALIQHDDDKLIMICKADDMPYLNEDNFTIARGLPIEKKIYKAFLCRINKANEIISVKVLDTNPSMSQYWWKEFLELSELYNDEHNTKKSFDALDNDVFQKMKRAHPQDYVTLRNSTVGYYRSNQGFEINDYIEKVIHEYKPHDPNMNISDLEATIRGLPEKRKFDNQFSILKEHVKAKFKSNITLTPQIELVIKENVPNLENTIFAELGNDGAKYVKIRSDEGYRHFVDKV